MKKTRRYKSRRNRKSRKVGGNFSLFNALINEDIYSFEDTLRADPDSANMMLDADNTILMYTIRHNLSEFTQKLLEYGADVNQPNSKGFTPLFTAIQMNNSDLVALLLSRGANANHQSLIRETIEISQAETPLYTAIIKNNPDIVALLLSHGADPNLPILASHGGPVYPLRWAIFSEKMESLPIIQMLVRAGADINRDETFAYDKSAYLKRNKDVAKAKIALLYDLGLNINKGDRWGTLLKQLLENYPNYDTEFIIYLLRRGANTLSYNNPNSLLIQVLELSNYIDFRSTGAPREDFLNFTISSLLSILPDSELQKRSPAGETPYMAAIKMGIEGPLLEMIKERTAGKNTNRNMYGTKASQLLAFKAAANERRNNPGV